MSRCTCYHDLTERLTKHIGEQLPLGAEQLEVALGGYVFGISDEGMTHRPALPITTTYKVPAKKGDRMRVVKKSQSMHATYCPFCGLSFKTGKPATEEGKDQ